MCVGPADPRTVCWGSGPVPRVLGAGVAVEACGGGEPLATLGAVQRQRGGGGGRRGRRGRVGGGVPVRVAVRLEERHPAEAAPALLALRPHSPPLLLQKG